MRDTGMEYLERHQTTQRINRTQRKLRLDMQSYGHAIVIIPSLFSLFAASHTPVLPPQIPHSLFREDGYDHREALFGRPPYGGSIAQNVYYADQDMCAPGVDTTIGYPTRPIDPKTSKQETWPTPYILMVDRGGCTFVQKVRCGLRYIYFREH